MRRVMVSLNPNVFCEPLMPDLLLASWITLLWRGVFHSAMAPCGPLNSLRKTPRAKGAPTNAAHSPGSGSCQRNVQLNSSAPGV